MKNWKKRSLIAVMALALTISSLLGATYASGLLDTAHNGTATGYTCPLTGDTLPCPNCCPLK